MTTAKKGIVKAVWLQMLAEGGYTTLREARQTFADCPPRVDRILQALAEQGCCVSAQDPTRPGGVRYGITPACKVPRDVKLGEILKAAGTA
jgi:hypothetical protein